MSKQGDCFFVALQMIQDYGSSYDRITPVKINKNISDDQIPKVIHALVTLEDGSVDKPHAWIEVGDWAIDFSNRNDCVMDRHMYKDIHQVREPKSFDRDTVLAVLYSSPPNPFWRYDDVEIKEIRANAEHLGGVWPPRIDFLQAFQSDKNPLALLHFPHK